ncbi:MAG: hypothetical protein ACFFAO_06975 [Candidatus Hermodarchaeota archaeon]
MYRSPEDIYSNFINKKISKKEALSQLMRLVESVSDFKIKVKSIEIIVKFEDKSKNLFNFLENYLISDENEFIRATAAKTIAFCFPKKAVKPLKWAKRHETSPLVLKTLEDLFKDFEEIYFK